MAKLIEFTLPENVSWWADKYKDTRDEDGNITSSVFVKEQQFRNGDRAKYDDVSNAEKAIFQGCAKLIEPEHAPVAHEAPKTTTHADSGSPKK